MRLGLVLRRIPLRHELSPSPFDAEWLVEHLGSDELFIHVDQDGPGSAMVRAAGGDVHVSPKRIIEVDGRATADEAALRHLASVHRQAPLDAVVVDGDLALAPLWLAPDLVGVPTGVTLGSEALGLSRIILDDRHLAQRHVMGLWGAAAALADADFHVGVAPPAAMGIAGIPARPILAPHRPAQSAARTPRSPSLVVVVSTVADRSGYASLIERTSARVDFGPGTTIVAVVPDVDIGAETPGQLLVAGAPNPLRSSVIVAPVGGDGVASAFLSAADVVVADSAADAAIPAVALRASEAPLVVLGPAWPVDPLPFAGEHLPAARPAGERIVLSVDGDLSAVAAALETADAELAVIHSEAGGAHASRLFSSMRPGGADVMVLCQPDLVHGSPRHERVVPSVVAIDRRSFGAAARVMRSVPDLWTFVAATMDPSNAGSLHLQILPAAVGARVIDLIAVDRPEHRWVGVGPFPLAARLDVVRAGTSASASSKAVVAPSARSWAKSHRWPDRVRMALPWKWGLLDRAMRGRW